MMRTGAALAILVALLAGCGSGTNSAGSTSLTPAAYRTKVNGLCAQAKKSLGDLTAGSAAQSTKTAAAAVDKALGIFKPILSTLQGLNPPSSLKSAHDQLVSSLNTLVDAGNTLIAKLKAGTPPMKALTAAQIRDLGTAFTTMKTSFTSLGVATCTSFVSGN